MPAAIARHRCAVSVPPAVPPLGTLPERAAAGAPPPPLSAAAQSPSLPTTKYMDITDVYSQKLGVEKNLFVTSNAGSLFI